MTAMLRKLNRIFEKARTLETALASTVEDAAGRAVGAPVVRQPLEVVHAVVDAVAQEIQPAGRGRNGFPFNAIRVTLLAPTARAKAQLQAVVDGPEPLARRVEARLRAAGCALSGLSVVVGFATKARADWARPDFDLVCLRLDTVDASGAAPQPRIDLVVTAGSAGRASYTFTAATIAIGRGTDICDSRGRLIRLNHIAFPDGDDEVNQTVSRLHARIEFEAASNGYRLFDDGSAQGTNVIRQGRGHIVPRGMPGMTLISGDELVLGRARLKVKLQR